MTGVQLSSYDWHYIWRHQNRKKILPDFQLNLFLQAKRSHAGKSPRGNIKKAGILGDYWKFDITPHQQLALERMSDKLHGKALVCYASPAFHTQAALYEHTKNQSIVLNSTFPPVQKMKGHGAWYYTLGGVSGVANPDYVKIEVEPLQTQIEKLVLQNERTNDAQTSLERLAKAIVLSAGEISEPAPVDTWFQQLLSRVDYNVSEFFEDAFQDDDDYIAAVKAYLTVKSFCTAYHLEWYVLGKAQQFA